MKAKGILVTILVIILIVGIGAGAYFIFQPSDLRQAVGSGCTGGATILSISEAVITDSSDLGGKEVIRITAVANGGGECAAIIFKENAINDALRDSGENSEATRDILGGLITNGQVEQFTTSERSQPVFKIGLDKKEEGLFCTVSNCEETYPDTIDAFRDLALGCWCVHKNLVGQGGEFDSTSKKTFDVDFFIDGIGTAKITDEKQSANIGDKAFIKWTGDLFSGTWLTTPNFDSYQQVGDSWRLVDDGFYDDVSDRLEKDTDDTGVAGTSGCIVGGTKDLPGFLDTRFEVTEFCANQYNSFVDLKTTNRDDEFVTRESSVNQVGWAGNKFLADLSTFTTWQVFTIDLDAESVGIHKVVGKPDVECPSGETSLVSGSQVTVPLKVRSSVDTNPSFSLGLECFNDGIGSLATNRINNVGTDFQTVNSFITITAEEETDFFCFFSAVDLNDPDNSDICGFDLTATPFTGCTVGAKTCSSDGSKVGTCTDGQNFNFVDCNFGCEAFEGSFRCKLQENEICDNGIDDDGDGLIDKDDPECKEMLGFFARIWKSINDFLFTFKIIFATIIGLIGGALAGWGTSTALKKSRTKKKALIIGIVFIISAIIVGLLAYFYFWLAVFAIIIFAIVKAFVPGI